MLLFSLFSWMLLLLGVVGLPPRQPHGEEHHHTPRHLTLAFLGDQGYGTHAQQVLRLVRDAGAAGLVLSGDLDYLDAPPLFLAQLEGTLGRRFPLFPAIGNHDVSHWNGTQGYQQLLTQHLRRARLSEPHCYGEVGIQYACVWNGLLLLSSGIGTAGTGHLAFLETALHRHASVPWKICSFHKNQHAYQTDDKPDETGYEVYEVCRRHGAIIATAHDHSYSRTHLMANFSSQAIASTDNTLRVEPGRTFSFVSGLGGESIRFWRNASQTAPWWAANAAMDNGVNYGALLCRFHVDAHNQEATCKFQDIDGTDRFRIVRGGRARRKEGEPAPVVLSPLRPPGDGGASVGNASDSRFALPSGPLGHCMLQVHPYSPRGGNHSSHSGKGGARGRAHRDRKAVAGMPLHLEGRWRWTTPSAGPAALLRVQDSRLRPVHGGWTPFTCHAEAAGQPCMAPLALGPGTPPGSRILHVLLDGRPPRIPVLVCLPARPA